MINGADGRKLSKRHGALSAEEFKRAGYLREALMNFLALLGWSYDDKTTIMSEQELIERFSFERVQGSPAVFDYQKLDWMNGVYIRALSTEDFADRLVSYLREQGYDWDEELIRRSAPLVQEKISTLGAYPQFAGFLFQEVEPDAELLDGEVLRGLPTRWSTSSRSPPTVSSRRSAASRRSSNCRPAKPSSPFAWRSPDPRSHPVCSKASSCWARSVHSLVYALGSHGPGERRHGGDRSRGGGRPGPAVVVHRQPRA